MSNDERRIWIFLTVVATAMAFWVGYLLNYSKPLTTAPMTVATTAHKTSAGIEPTASSVNPSAGSPTSEADLPAEMDRLHSALRQHASTSTRELIQEANAKSPAGSVSPCPFQWNRDQEELVISGDQLRHSFMAKAVASCTKAIESLP